METVSATPSGSAVDNRPAILYPLMLIAAIAVIVFSALGTVTMLGWMPEAISASHPPARSVEAPARAAPGAEPGRAGDTRAESPSLAAGAVAGGQR